MRILLIEDEVKIAGVIARGMKAENFAVDLATDGVDGLELATTYVYDVIILDISLPNMDGSQVLKRIRANNGEVPILMLTARDSVQEKIRHFEAGADDYLTKPFSFAELLVRIKALLRRRPTQQIDLIVIGDFELNRLPRIVKRAGKRIDLSPKEYALLEYLVVNAGRTLSRTMLIEHVWDQSFEGLTNIVDVYIRQLRVKVDNGYDRKYIRTIRGAGYVFEDGGEA
jgi:two-component system copper resistance phosphate regulon response regulator CusR